MPVRFTNSPRVSWVVVMVRASSRNALGIPSVSTGSKLPRHKLKRSRSTGIGELGRLRAQRSVDMKIISDESLTLIRQKMHHREVKEKFESNVYDFSLI